MKADKSKLVKSQPSLISSCGKASDMNWAAKLNVYILKDHRSKFYTHLDQLFCLYSLSTVCGRTCGSYSQF